MVFSKSSMFFSVFTYSVVILLCVFYVKFINLSAENQALFTGERAHEILQNEKIRHWANDILSNAPKSVVGDTFIIPRDEWFSYLGKYSELFLNDISVSIKYDVNEPTGILIEDGICGIVIPNNNVIPMINYEVLHNVNHGDSFFYSFMRSK